MTGQILWGSLFLGLCAAIHLACIVAWIEYLKKRSSHARATSRINSIFLPIGGTFLALVFSHTLQVWLWAAAFVLLNALPNLSEAIYFSLVTYTTLGYGDIILSQGHKIFGAMAAVTGLLNFGVSTAVLVGVISKVLPNQFGR